MAVRLSPETERKLNELAAQTGRATDELVEDAMAGYLAELTGVRDVLGKRYNDLKSRRVPPVDGEEALARIREKSARRRNHPA
jgi:predicted transcriptional regulator